jgi:hypothetical protein
MPTSRGYTREIAKQRHRPSNGHPPVLGANLATAMHLVLRRANISRSGGSWSETDFDVFDGDRKVGRIYRLDDRPDSAWFWGVSFQLTGRKSYGHAASIDEAKAAFKAEYEAWKNENGSTEC